MITSVHTHTHPCTTSCYGSVLGRHGEGGAATTATTAEGDDHVPCLTSTKNGREFSSGGAVQGKGGKGPADGLTQLIREPSERGEEGLVGRVR